MFILDLENKTFNNEPILQILNTENTEKNEYIQLENSKPSINFINPNFKKFINEVRHNTSTGTNIQDINIIPIDPYDIYKDQYYNYFKNIEQQQRIQQQQQLQKQIQDLNLQINNLQSDIDKLKLQNSPLLQIDIQNKQSDIEQSQQQIQNLQMQQNLNTETNIRFDRNINMSNNPFMNIILSSQSKNHQFSSINFILIYISNDFEYPNLNIIGKRNKPYFIGPIVTVVPYIDNDKLKYKPLTQLIESCPSCTTCPKCEICEKCEICPIFNNKPYIIGLSVCGIIILLLCILIYTKSKS